MSKSPPTGRTIDTGFLKGKGTLVVTSGNGSANTFYFENEGTNNKSVSINSSDSFHWTAPNDSDLIYFELTDVLIRPAPVVQQKVPVPAPPPTQPREPEITKKLFLGERSISETQARALQTLIGKPFPEIKIAYVANAADVESSNDAYQADNLKLIERLGGHIEAVVLVSYMHNPIALLQKLEHKDVIWIGDGNVYYLYWSLHATRADEIITHMSRKGTVVYVGYGAGAVVAGPTLKHFELMYNKEGIPELAPGGPKLLNEIVVPHVDNPKLSEATDQIMQLLLHERLTPVPLKDDQVLLINGGSQETIYSPRKTNPRLFCYAAA